MTLAGAMQACLAAPPVEIEAMGPPLMHRVKARHDVDA